MTLKEVLLNTMVGALETIGESKMEDILNKFHDTHPEAYKVTILSGYTFLKAIQPLTDKSKTPIDDAIVDLELQAIEASAAKNGIELPK